MQENKDYHRDWGVARQTFDLLCTMTRLGLKFNCPVEKVIRLKLRTAAKESTTYRRIIK